MMRASPWTAVLLAAAATVWVRPSMAADVLSLGRDFCDAQLQADEAALRSLLTPSLAADVVEAEKRSDAIGKANPDEKPPFGDGIPYQSFPDLADGCEPAAVPGEGAQVDIRYAFNGQPDAGWTDRLILSEAQGPLAIDDIQFRGAPVGGTPVSLRTVLRGAFDQ